MYSVLFFFFGKILPVVDIHNAVRTGTISVTIYVLLCVDRTFILSMYGYFFILLQSVQPLKMSTRDLSWGKGGRCVRLTTYHPRSAERQENPGP